MVRELNQAELTSVIIECDRVSQTNCWWAAYWCAPLLRQLCSDALTIPRPADTGVVKKPSHNNRKPKRSSVARKRTASALR